MYFVLELVIIFKTKIFSLINVRKFVAFVTGAVAVYTNVSRFWVAEIMYKTLKKVLEVNGVLIFRLSLQSGRYRIFFVWNRVRFPRSWPYTPTKDFEEYLPPPPSPHGFAC